MKIKTLMDFLNKESNDSDDEKEAAARHFAAGGQREENVVYIETARLETAGEQHQKNALLASSPSRASPRLASDCPRNVSCSRPSAP